MRINPVSRRTLLLSVLLSCGIVAWADELERIVALIIPPPQWLDQLGQFLRVEDPLSLTLIFIGAVPWQLSQRRFFFVDFFSRSLKTVEGCDAAVLVGESVFRCCPPHPLLGRSDLSSGCYHGIFSMDYKLHFPQYDFARNKQRYCIQFCELGRFFRGVVYLERPCFSTNSCNWHYHDNYRFQAAQQNFNTGPRELT